MLIESTISICKLAWHFDNHGKISVKSAYKVYRAEILRSLTRGGAQSSSSTQSDSHWKSIWKLKLSCKIRHFSWRLDHNSHPLRCNLLQRGMEIDNRCLVCNSVGEDGGHLFFKCDMAKEVWRGLQMEDIRVKLAATSLIEDTVGLILKLKEEQKLRLIIAMWFLWYERNQIREEGRRGAEFIVRNIQSYAAENAVEQNENSMTSNSTMLHRVKWTKPPPGIIKLNCDASFFLGPNSGSWGFLIRDNDGDVVVATRGKLDHLLSAFQAELIACLQCLQAAIDLGIAHIILETDAKMVVQAITTNEYDDTAMGVLIMELKSLASTAFSFICLFKNHDCNRAAHELASLGRMCIQGEAQICSFVP